jgi:hypothetical protein
VGERESRGDLDPEHQYLLDGKRPVAVDQLLEVVAVDVLEDDELQALVLTPVDHPHDVLVREAGSHARLATEALDVLVLVAQAAVEDLERDRSLQHAVVRAIDGRHAAGAGELLELVPACEDITDDQWFSVPGPEDL